MGLGDLGSSSTSYYKDLSINVDVISNRFPNINNNLLNIAEGGLSLPFKYVSFAKREERRLELQEERERKLAENSRWFRDSVQMSIDFPE